MDLKPEKAAIRFRAKDGRELHETSVNPKVARRVLCTEPEREVQVGNQRLKQCAMFLIGEQRREASRVRRTRRPLLAMRRRHPLPAAKPARRPSTGKGQPK